MLPPVPTEKAIRCQTGSSVPIENIPILAATKGTLSITADPTPKSAITISVLGIAVFNPSAKLNKLLIADYNQVLENLSKLFLSSMADKIMLAFLNRAKFLYEQQHQYIK